MKKKAFLVPLLLLALTACGPTGPSTSLTEESSTSKTLTITLEAPTNLLYEDGVFSFDAVSGATGYEIEFTSGGEIVYSDTVTSTAIDVTSLGIGGRISARVRAVADEAASPWATYEFTVLATVEDVFFEAENYLYNFGTGKEQSNFRNNTLAHGGAYVGGIDDAGQGVYIDYLCPVAGTYEFLAYYTTDMAPAHNDVWVNGEYQARLEYTVKTGWGASGFYAPEMAKVEISLVEGWNTISVMKNGDSSDNWGSFAELDYFVLKGNGETYDPSALEKYGEHPVYRLEAEMGSPRKRDNASGLYTCKNPAIVEDGTYSYSNGFLLGNIESNYDGVEWHFNSPVKATYSINAAYAAGSFEGSKLPKISFIVTQEAVSPSRNMAFADYEIKTIDGLEYTGWNTVQETPTSVEIELEQGDNYIYCLLLTGNGIDSGFFQLDYCDLTFVSAAN